MKLQRRSSAFFFMRYGRFPTEQRDVGRAERIRPSDFFVEALARQPANLAFSDGLGREKEIALQRRADEITGEMKRGYHAATFADDAMQADDTFFHLEKMVHLIALPANRLAGCDGLGGRAYEKRRQRLARLNGFARLLGIFECMVVLHQHRRVPWLLWVHKNAAASHRNDRTVPKSERL